ncbi:hypothetical protein [Clostridium perfringens]|uniref:hypothetical protein n=1 Tax=Clostridium perfringens TaxID=1502 RepID=UPI000B147C82|nr:hypothetical protein [Clostridium perfringens]
MQGDIPKNLSGQTLVLFAERPDKVVIEQREIFITNGAKRIGINKFKKNLY